MTAATRTQTPETFGPVPVLGTYPVAANTLIYKGCMVCLDSNGRAVNAADDGNGYNVVGWARQEVDNRTTAPSGGGAGALNVDVDFGVVEYAYTGTAPLPRTVVYCADNVTVASSSTSAVSGTRGVAGIVTQVDTTNTVCRVFVSTLNQNVADLTAAITAVETSVGTDDTKGDLFTRAALAEVDLSTVVVSLGALRLSTGAAIAAFADNTTDGFELSGSECLGIRWNDSGSSRITVAGEFQAPANWDDAENVTMYLDGFRVGSADATMVCTVALFAQEIGDAYTADDDAGGSSTAFDGATTVLTRESLTITAGDIPAGSKVSFTVVPDAALDGDDFVLTGIRFVGARASAA